MDLRMKNRINFIINTVFIAIIIGIVYLVFKYAIGWLMPFLLAFCIVSLVNPLINLIKKHLKIKQEIISIFVMALIYAIVGVLIFLIIMQLAFGVMDAFTHLAPYYNQAILPALEKAGNSLMSFINGLPLQWRQQVENMQGEIIKALQNFLIDLSQKSGKALANMTKSIPSFLIAFIFTIMLSFFISMQYGQVVQFIKYQMPEKLIGFFSNLKTIIRSTIFKYLKATLTLLLITFVEIVIGLLLLQVKNAIPIAAGIAVFDALPFFGTGAILLPWAIIELLQGNYHLAVGLLLVYGIVLIIRNIIEPKIVGDKLGLNPIVTLTAIYLGFRLFGVLGMIMMPMLTQITLELHKNGNIMLFKEKLVTDDKSMGGVEE